MQLQNVVYFLVWAGFIYFMMRFGCGAHVMGYGHRHGDGHAGGHDVAAAPPRAVDPVCGNTVDTASAKSSAYRGRIYYFDSSDCRSAFEANPAAYGAVAAPENEHRGHRHGC